MGATYKLKRKLADGTLEDVVLQGVGGGGSAEPFIVTFTNDGNDNYTADATYEDIEQAFANGKIVIGKDATDSYIYQIFGLSDDDTIPFSRIVNWGGNGAVVETLFVNTDDSVLYARDTLGGGSSSGGVAQLQQSVTYTQLKALRDNGELVAGMQYRITDFVTTTSQSDTQSAGHPFDIIVTALSNTTLSENASADYHKVADVGGATFDPSVLADEDGNLDQDAVVAHYYIYEDISGPSEEGPVEGYKPMDTFVAYGYLENSDGVVVPVIYKNDLDGYSEEGPDYEDIFYYEGTMEVDGVTYDKWRKICETQESGPFWDGRTGKIWVLTNVIVNSGGATYFANSNLPAWEIKYCLDNDKTRFVWADEGNIEAIKVYSADDVSDYIYVRTPNGDNENGIAWCYVIDSEGLEFSDIADWNNYDTADVIYTENETVAVGDFLDMSGTEVEVLALKYGNAGKGVIYYMKDEWGNECPYDFKNIQFKRYAVTATEVQEKEFMIYEQGSQDIKYAYGTSLNGCTVDSENSAYYYTFSYVLQTGDVQDLTIVGNKLRPDYEDNCVQNKMGIYIPENYEGDNKLYLSNNVCVTTELWYIDNDDVLCYSYNTFGNNCSYNTFGSGCYCNTFSNYCDHNIFGYNCNYNTFGSGCYRNTFGTDCSYNTFSNSCRYNTFGSSCGSNTFGSSCSSNTFGDDCYYNTFSNSCDSNTLSQYALYNIFENGVNFVTLTSTTQGNFNNCIQNITVSQGVKGTSSSNRKTINATRNLAYKTTYVAQGSVTTEV